MSSLQWIHRRKYGNNKRIIAYSTSIVINPIRTLKISLKKILYIFCPGLQKDRDGGTTGPKKRLKLIGRFGV